MPNTIRDLRAVDESSFDYICEENVAIPLKAGGGLIRCNVYRPKVADHKCPVLVTVSLLMRFVVLLGC